MSNSLIVPVHILSLLTKPFLLQLPSEGGIADTGNKTVPQLRAHLEGKSIPYRNTYVTSPELAEDCTLAEQVLKKLLTEGKIELPVPSEVLFFPMPVCRSESWC